MPFETTRSNVNTGYPGPKAFRRKMHPLGVRPWVVVLLLVTLEPRPVATDCRECVSNSECVNNECQCKPGYSGTGDFFCADLDTHKCCCGNNDPVLVTTDGSSVVYHLLGSTQLVEINTPRKPLFGGSEGQCRFQLWGWTERYKGKLFYAGLTFQIDQVTHSLNNTESGHLHGQATPGEPYDFSFRITGTTVYSGEDDMCGINFRLINWNFLRASIPCCGIQFAIRPYHPDYPYRTPGYWFTAEKADDASLMTKHFSLPPPDAGLCVSTHSIINITGISKIRLAASFYAMTNSDVTDYPSAAQGLAAMKAVLRNCPRSRRDELMRVVDLFFNPHLMKCLNGIEGKSVDLTVQGITNSARYICSDFTWACHQMQDMLRDKLLTCSKVLQSYPDIDRLANEYCPPPN